MTTDIDAIAETIGAAGPIKDRIKKLVDVIQRTGDFEADHIFVSEYTTKKNEDQKRVFESLWLIKDAYIHEAKNFLHDVKFDSLHLERFYYWEIEYLNLDNLEQPMDESRINLELSAGMSTSAIFHATGQNCSNLMNLFKSEIKPRMGT